MFEIVLDIETTGVNKFEDYPIQIAWQTLNFERKTIEKGDFYIWSKPFLSPKIEEITGITQDFLRENGLSNLKGTTRYMNLIRRWQPCTLVGHNLIASDYPILHNWMERFFEGRFKQPPITKLVDTMHMASTKFHTRRWLPLEECARRLDIIFNKDQLHNAKMDASLTKAVYLTLLN